MRTPSKFWSRPSSAKSVKPWESTGRGCDAPRSGAFNRGRNGPRVHCSSSGPTAMPGGRGRARGGEAGRAGTASKAVRVWKSSTGSSSISRATWSFAFQAEVPCAGVLGGLRQADCRSGPGQ
uniref:Uncharacterized protein n=1 Tax=Alexandrium monilatum TaxID=311494 RepID=A0A7S4PVB8_9DINO